MEAGRAASSASYSKGDSDDGALGVGVDEGRAASSASYSELPDIGNVSRMNDEEGSRPEDARRR